MTQRPIDLAFVLVVIGLSIAPRADARTLYRFKTLTGISGAQSSNGLSINDRNIVTGSVTLQSGYTHAYKTDQDSNMIDLGVPDGMQQSYGIAINNNGQVTGFGEQYADIPFVASPPNVSNNQMAFVTDANDNLLSLGSLGGTNIMPSGINAAGQVTGSASTATSELNNIFAFLGKLDTRMINLGTLGGSSTSIGRAINDAGIVVGFINTPTADKAFVTDTNGQNMRELLPDQPNSIAGGNQCPRSSCRHI